MQVLPCLAMLHSGTNWLHLVPPKSDKDWELGGCVLHSPMKGNTALLLLKTVNKATPSHSKSNTVFTNLHRDNPNMKRAVQKNKTTAEQRAFNAGGSPNITFTNNFVFGCERVRQVNCSFA